MSAAAADARRLARNASYCCQRRTVAAEEPTQMLRITTAQLNTFRRIRAEFPEKPSLPSRTAWRDKSDDDVWIRVVSQVVVVGRAAPSDRLYLRATRQRIAWKRVRRMTESEAAKAIWSVLRDIKARYAGREWRSCRKTAALVRNLAFLKAYPKGPKGFLRDVATLKGTSQDKIAFVAGRLSYIKNKGARDFLTTGFGLVKDHIALDSRVRGVLKEVGVVIPAQTVSSAVLYEGVERELLEQVCRPLGMNGAEFDQLLFTHAREIKKLLERTITRPS